MAEKGNEWFGEWFDSRYYHILYKHRDHDEAKRFIDNLIAFFKIDTNHKVLDLACGKGRHAIYINRKGYDVVGVDLSAKNIEHARHFESENLHFYIHDMREVFASNEFDIILNLFTSFGYFDQEEENEKAICAVAKALKPRGSFLIDFLNPFRVINNLVQQESKVVNGITFDITRSLSEDDYIVKDIRFTDKNKKYHFQERVKAIRREEFLKYFEKAGLKVIATFGDYELNPYRPETSERMIFVTQK